MHCRERNIHDFSLYKLSSLGRQGTYGQATFGGESGASLPTTPPFIVSKNQFVYSKKKGGGKGEPWVPPEN